MLRHAKDVCPASLALSGSLWLTLALAVRLSLVPSGSLRLSLALSGSLWLSQAFSGSLRLSLALYCSPNLLTKPLLGSQGPCSARSVATALQHFIQPCSDIKGIVKYLPTRGKAASLETDLNFFKVSRLEIKIHRFNFFISQLSHT